MWTTALRVPGLEALEIDQLHILSDDIDWRTTQIKTTNSYLIEIIVEFMTCSLWGIEGSRLQPCQGMKSLPLTRVQSPASRNGQRLFGGDLHDLVRTAPRCSIGCVRLVNFVRYSRRMERNVGLDETPGKTPSGDAERRHLSVVFCDLVGSTPFPLRSTPRDWRT